MKYYLIAGEASGDLHASNLMKAILKYDSQASFRFIGGDLMASVSGTMLRHYKDMAYMGFWPVLTHLGTILRSAGNCFQDIREWEPDTVILVDYPGFNLSIAKLVKTRLGIPTCYYISPKIWAWKSYRIKSIRKYVDRLFSILPFEVGWFAQRGYEISYVGNPCVDAVSQYMSSDLNAVAKSDKPVIALLAGSRKTEIKRNLPIMIKAVQEFVTYQPVLAAAPGIDDSFYRKWTDGTNVQTVRGQTYRLLSRARAALVTSGTATLETALLRIPQVVCYRMPASIFAKAIRAMLIKVPFISLVNLIDSSMLVPELVAGDMNVRNVRKQLFPLLQDGPARKKQLDGYDRIIRLLGQSGASDNAARSIVAMLDKDRC